MIKRIIQIVESPFNRRDYKRFGVETLKKNGFRVEIWDLSRILRSRFYADVTVPEIYKCDELTAFYEKKEVFRRISELGVSDFVINLGSYGINSFWVYRALTKANVQYAVQMSGMLPVLGPTETVSAGYWKKLKKIFPPSFRYISNVFFSRMPSKWLGIKPAKFILAGGEKCFVYHFPVDRKKNTETIWVHAMDYDLYLAEYNRSFSEPEESIAVFLDEYLPLHPDRLYDGVKNLLSPEEYYVMLDRFFKRVEDKLKLEVVIAASPRSKYENNPNYFGERKCIKGKTPELVRKSKLVLAHDSSSLTFANLFHKPVMFLTSRRLSISNPPIRRLANWFGKEPIFMDVASDVDWDFEMTVNKERYETYKRMFIKTNFSPEKPFWQIVSDRLKEKI
ncbi:MAG: hypothetical protein ABIH85_08615 [Candidatus Omnitrophota bacterium]